MLVHSDDVDDRKLQPKREMSKQSHSSQAYYTSATQNDSDVLAARYINFCRDIGMCIDPKTVNQCENLTNNTSELISPHSIISKRRLSSDETHSSLEKHWLHKRVKTAPIQKCMKVENESPLIGADQPVLRKKSKLRGKSIKGNQMKCEKAVFKEHLTRCESSMSTSSSKSSSDSKSVSSSLSRKKSISLGSEKSILSTLSRKERWIVLKSMNNLEDKQNPDQKHPFPYPQLQRRFGSLGTLPQRLDEIQVLPIESYQIPDQTRKCLEVISTLYCSYLKER